MSTLAEKEVLGFVVADPRLDKTSRNGTDVCNLTVVTEHIFKDLKSGDEIIESQYHDVRFWREKAQMAFEKFRKGTQVLFKGRIIQTEQDHGGRTFRTDILEPHTYRVVRSSNRRTSNKSQPVNVSEETPVEE